MLRQAVTSGPDTSFDTSQGDVVSAKHKAGRVIRDQLGGSFGGTRVQ